MTVVVCSVGRPVELERSLSAIRNQSVLPDEILVVAQSADAGTIEVAQSTTHVRCVQVDRPGLAHAIETAIATARCDVVAFVDDDAVAHADWVDRIRSAFNDPDLGAVGGRDNVHGDSSSVAASDVVGAVDVWGRLVGNHHLGVGIRRNVLTVKGANMAIRRTAAIGIPLATMVLGVGAQYRNETILAAALITRGFRIDYDSSIQVDHYPAARMIGDGRDHYTPDRIYLNVRNELLALHLGQGGVKFLRSVLFVLLVGSTNHPGLMRFPELRQRHGWQRFGAVVRAVWDHAVRARSTGRIKREIALGRFAQPVERPIDQA